MKVVLNLDFPPRQLNPNGRYHWSVKAKAAAQYRSDCKIDAVNMRNMTQGTWPMKPPVKATITFIIKDKRRHDPVNLYRMFKPGEDGLVDAKILVDDDFKNYHPELRMEAGIKNGIRIELEEIDGER